MSLSNYIFKFITNNYSILFSITNTISVTYNQLLLIYLVPIYIPVCMNKSWLLWQLLVSNVRGYIEFMEIYCFDFNINIIRSGVSRVYNSIIFEEADNSNTND